LMVFTFSSTFGQDIDLTNGLAGYWSFNESEGFTAADGSGNGNDLTFVGDPEWIEGKMGNAVYFYQSLEDSIITYAMQYDSLLHEDFPSVSRGDSSISALTLACWLRYDWPIGSGQPIDRMSMITKEQIDNRGFTFELKNEANLAAQIYKNNSDATKPISDGLSMELDVWYHVAMTYEFIEDGYSMCILYVDGEEDFYTDFMVGPLTNNAAPLRIGAYIYDPNPGGYRRFFYGTLDEVYVYNRALPQDEIKALMEYPGPNTRVMRSQTPPALFVLKGNYPNPFNPITALEYSLAAGGHVRLTILDVQGHEIAILVNETQTAGEYKATFDATDYASGVYFYQLSVNGMNKNGKMTVLR